MQKPNFSVAEAFAAGVDLIERAFKSVLIWALAMFLLALVPACVAFVVQGGHFIVPDGGFKLSGVTGLNSGLVMEERRQLLGANLAYWLLGAVWAVVGAAVIYAAIYRTTWARKTLPSGGLRLGAAEGWLSLVMVVQALGLIILILAVWMLLLVLALVAAILGPPFSGWALAAGGVAVVAAALWVVLRLCLCQAMTVAENRFRFFEFLGPDQGPVLEAVLDLQPGARPDHRSRGALPRHGGPRDRRDLRRHDREPEDRPARANPRVRRSDRPALAGLRLAAGRPAESASGGAAGVGVSWVVAVELTRFASALPAKVGPVWR